MRVRRSIFSLGLCAAVSGESAVRQIVSMLKEMQTTLAADAAADKKVYDKMQCWCKETMPKLREASDTNDALAKSEAAAAEAAKASAKKLNQEIVELNDKIKTEDKNLRNAIEQRSKDLVTFKATMADLTESHNATKRAVVVLSKHHAEKSSSEAFLQSSSPLASVRDALKSALDKNINGNVAVSSSDRSAISEFMQQPTYGAYKSASGQIFGILQSMQEEFERDLRDTLAAEKAASAAHAEMVGIKTKLLADFRNSVEVKTVKKLNEERKAAESTALSKAAREAAISDAAALKAATEQCQASVKDYADRSKARAEEQHAVQTALGFLDSDEGRALMRKTESSFLQVSSVKKSINLLNGKHAIAQKKHNYRQSVENARRALLIAGSRLNDPKLLIMAQTLENQELEVTAGVFDKILLAIQELVQELESTLKSDQEEYNGCTMSIEERTYAIKELSTTIAHEDEKLRSTENQIIGLKQGIKELNKEIKDVQKEMKDAGFLRDEANENFVNAYQTNDAAVKLLQQAIGALSEAYAKEAALIQQSPNDLTAETRDTPEQIEAYSQNAGGQGALKSLHALVDTIKSNMKHSVQTESEEQASYAYVVETSSMAAKRAFEERKQKKSELVNQERTHQTVSESRTANGEELNSLSEALVGKKKSCAFIVGNLEIRKVHMAEEIGALRSADQFLRAL